MAYGTLKVDTLVYDDSGSDVSKTIASLAAAASTSSPTFTGTVTIPTAAITTCNVSGNLVVTGNLTVNGSTTTVNTATLDVEDKNITLGKVSTPSDTTAAGGGITLKGATDKTFTWNSTWSAWLSSEHIHLGDDKELQIGNNNDLKLFHNGTNSFIRSSVGDLQINGGNSAGNVEINLNENVAGGTKELAAKFVKNGASEIYYDNSKKLETTSAGVTVTGTVSDSKGNLRSIPRSNQSSAYTLVASDAGKCVTAGGNITVNNSVFAEGDTVSIIADTSSDITITQGSGVTMYNTADAATGNRTLAARGICTIWFVAASNCYISGAGLS